MKNMKIPMVFAVMFPLSAQGTVEELEVSQSAAFDSREEAENLQAEDSGVVVTSVVEESPAGQAGIRRGDIILGFNGETVNSVFEFRQAVVAASQSQSAQIELLRGEKLLTITVDEESGSTHPLIGIHGVGTGRVRSAGQFGMFGPQGRHRPSHGYDGQSPAHSGMPFGGKFGLYPDELPEGVAGAVEQGNAARIARIIPGSPADDAGLTSGMIIYHIDGNEVADGNLKTEVSSYRPGDSAVLSTFDGEQTNAYEIVFGDVEESPYLGVVYYPVQQMQQRYGEELSRMRGMPSNNNPKCVESWRSPGTRMNGRSPR